MDESLIKDSGVFSLRQIRVSALHLLLEWHGEWSAAVSDAFAAMPYDHLMDSMLVRRLWEDGLGREIDCDNVSFTRTPVNTRMLRPEESWVVALEPTYAELMQRTKYARKDRQCRQRSAHLTVLEDRYDDLPEALEHWQAKWREQGSRVAATRKDDLLLSFRILAEQGRLKTFSLHDGDKFAAMEMNMIGPATMYAMTAIMRDEYRPASAGNRLTLAAMEWGCAHGMAEYDMLWSSGHYKKRWAEPLTRSYRLIRRPLGSEALGCAVEEIKNFVWALRHKTSATPELTLSKHDH